MALNDTIMVVRLRADRRAAARPVGDHRAVGHAADLGRALHRDPGAASRRRWRARAAGARARRRSTRRMAQHRPVVDRGAAGDAGAAVRLPGRGDPASSRWSSRCSRCRS
ncbi:MAG: hypothetical protein MZW92_07180 [Comamonadaceae bacterium]|nr:hypothetical protein [Comamonadaceae bacterium]